MAFRQPTHAPPQRSPHLDITTSTPEQTIQTQHPTTSTNQHHFPTAAVEEEEQWIIFSSTTNAGSSTNRTSTTVHSHATPRTAGRSRISDFGSLDTAARSYDVDGQSLGDVAVEEDDEEEDEGELELELEDGELDSLDSHLHEFRSESSVYRREMGGTVLPTHDGLGSFRIDRPAGMGADVQEHLYSFERFNPRRRVKRRREDGLGEAVQNQAEGESERAADVERMRRIEAWRMEQSRLLVDEIQKETRRRKMSFTSEKRSVQSTALEKEQEDLATLSTIGIEDGDVGVDVESESFWNRVTRRVIRDLMGIDDDLLSIIFGESLPEDDDLSTTPPANGPISNSLVAASRFDESTWEHKLLERIARELGILVNQISDHPGAFNTYLKTQQTPLPYAGLPVIPETSSRDQPFSADPHHSSSTHDPIFHPTIQTQPVSIPSPQQPTSSLLQQDENATPRQHHQHTLTREEWEADLDISLVFSYLRNRFTSRFRRPSQNSSMSIHNSSHLATSSTADTAARAARVRQHHPLVKREVRERERRRSIEKRTWRVSVPDQASSASGIAKARLGMGLRDREREWERRGGGVGGGSCAASADREREKVRSVRSGSSRHYWDFGPASVGSGSLVGGAGGGGGVLGSWGEV